MKNKWLVLMATLVLAISCGGGGTPEEEENGEENGGGVAPTVSSLKDAADTAIETTGSTTANPVSFTLTFDQEMDLTTLSNITLACGTLTPGITVAAGGTTGAYTITVTDAWKYALLTCTLTIPPTVKSSAATALAEEKTYEFTNPCAVSDDFNADSISSTCWQIATAEQFTLTTWDAMNPYFDLNTANSTLDFDFSTGDAREYASLTKTVSFDENGFEAELYFKNISGFTQTVGQNSDAAVLFIGNVEGFTRFYMMEVVAGGPGGGTQTCAVMAATTDWTYCAVYGAACSNADMGYYIKLAVSPTVATIKYKEEGGEWQDLPKTEACPDDMPTWTGDWAFSESGGVLGLVFDDVEGGPAQGAGALDYVRTTGFAVTSQY